MKCEKCKRHIMTVKINKFKRDGNDHFVSVPIRECQNNAIRIDTTQNWCGFELTEEEQAETILCPNCYQFPFKDKEIHVHEIVRVVCFTTPE